MNKPGWIFRLSSAVIWGVILSACTTSPAPAEIVFQLPPETILAGSLPLDLPAPPVLPASIQDEQLLDAWIYLYHQLDPVGLWDGSRLTGRDLAQFALEQAIPVVWDLENVCQGGACSILFCRKNACIYEDGLPGVDPIYIHADQRGHLQQQVDTLAHELYHRRQPFGPVQSTRFEEFWGYSVGAQISGSAWPEFEGVDPLVPGQLVRWFKDNHIHGYYGLQYYPPRLAGVSPVASYRPDVNWSIP